MGPKKDNDDNSPSADDCLGGCGAVDNDSAYCALQLLVGSAVGCAGGYMDATYIEPFGWVFGGSLALAQVLDHEGFINLFWNDHETRATSRKGGKNTPSIMEEFKEFSTNNLYVAGGFAAGFAVATYIVENY